MEVVASLSQGRTAAAHCGLFTYKSVSVIFEPPCMSMLILFKISPALISGFTFHMHHAVHRLRPSWTELCVRWCFCHKKSVRTGSCVWEGAARGSVDLSATLSRLQNDHGNADTKI